jgi:ABC-2 type transport system ATP-binding protein
LFLVSIIEVSGLTKHFKNTVALDGVSFEANQGEVFGCLGHNGAGKTTLVRLILGLLAPTSGWALAWGSPLTDKPVLRKKVGVLLEHDGLYDNLTAAENLIYYARLYGVNGAQARAGELISYVGLTDRKDDRVGTYSRGMRRRLGLARAILHQPSVLLLDEPSAGLDPEVQKMVRGLILELAGNRNILVFLNSHDLDEVERTCVRIMILQRGKVIACESLKNLHEQYNQPSVQMVFADRVSAERAAEALKTSGLTGRGAVEGKTVTAVLASGGPGDIINLLTGCGIKVEEVKRTGRSLEDIYLEIVHREETRV